MMCIAAANPEMRFLAADHDDGSRTWLRLNGGLKPALLAFEDI